MLYFIFFLPKSLAFTRFPLSSGPRGMPNCICISSGFCTSDLLSTLQPAKIVFLKCKPNPMAYPPTTLWCCPTIFNTRQKPHPNPFAVWSLLASLIDFHRYALCPLTRLSHGKPVPGFPFHRPCPDTASPIWNVPSFLPYLMPFQPVGLNSSSPWKASHTTSLIVQARSKPPTWAQSIFLLFIIRWVSVLHESRNYV